MIIDIICKTLILLALIISITLCILYKEYLKNEERKDENGANKNGKQISSKK